jgi:hypothetical protein
MLRNAATGNLIDDLRNKTKKARAVSTNSTNFLFCKSLSGTQKKGPLETFYFCSILAFLLRKSLKGKGPGEYSLVFSVSMILPFSTETLSHCVWLKKTYCKELKKHKKHGFLGGRWESMKNCGAYSPTRAKMGKSLWDQFCAGTDAILE